MAWPVNAVDITASASTPGVTKPILLPSTSMRGASENPASSSTGMINRSSSCSPLRSMARISAPACAATMRGSGAAPGLGVKSIVILPSPLPDRLTAAPCR